MGNHRSATPLEDSDVRLRAGEVTAFDRQGASREQIAEWLDLDPAEVAEILADPLAYMRRRGVTAKACESIDFLPPPTEIARMAHAEFRAAMATRARQGARDGYWRGDVPYQPRVVVRIETKRRGY